MKINLARVGRKFGQLPFAFKVQKRPLLQMDRHPMRAPLRVPSGQDQAGSVKADRDACDDDILVTLEDDRIGTPRQERWVMLGCFDHVEGLGR